MPSSSAQIREIAVFDFDGTSIDGQSGALFTTYLLRHRIMKLPRAIQLGLWGLRYKLHLPHRQNTARELVFGALDGMDPATVDQLMRAFHDEVLAPRYRKAAFAEVARRNEEGCVTLLVSATFDVIADVAAQAMGAHAAIATKMARDAEGNYTGYVDGTVIAGSEKYLAAKRWCDANYGEGGWELAYAYGDHHTDADLLSHAKKAYAVCPGKSLRAAAKKNGWEIVDWDN